MEKNFLNINKNIKTQHKKEKERKGELDGRVQRGGYETGVTKTGHWKLQPDKQYLILGLVFLFWFIKLSKKG